MHKITTVKAVINTEFGGFSVPKLAAEWLRDNKGWTIGTIDDFNSTVFDLYEAHCYCRHTAKYNNTEFRLNPDLIECIETLQSPYKDMSHYDKHYNKNHDLKELFCLSVVEVDINLSIVDYHDGKERVELEYTRFSNW